MDISAESTKAVYSRIDFTETCWLWKGTILTQGYGQFNLNGKKWLTHRLLYEMTRGPIPEGATLDHLCRVRRCCNPYHLEICGRGENVLRSPLTITAKFKAQTHCKRGHEFTPENTRIIYLQWGTTGRGCRACDHLRYLAGDGANRKRRVPKYK